MISTCCRFFSLPAFLACNLHYIYLNATQTGGLPSDRLVTVNKPLPAFNGAVIDIRFRSLRIQWKRTAG
jgi:hypothetical protein